MKAPMARGINRFSKTANVASGSKDVKTDTTVPHHTANTLLSGFPVDMPRPTARQNPAGTIKPKRIHNS